MKQLLTEHALENSSSKLTQLQSQVDAQQVMIRHLKQQLQEASLTSEQLSTSRIRETVLEEQIKQLTDELRDAKRHYTPVSELLYYCYISKQLLTGKIASFM